MFILDNGDVIDDNQERKLYTATDLIKMSSVAISTVRFNNTLRKKGILLKEERPSTKDRTKTKVSWRLNQDYEIYGKSFKNRNGDYSTRFYKENFDQLIAHVDLCPI